MTWWREEGIPDPVRKGLDYAQDVVDGKIVAGRLTILACQRSLRELENGVSGFYFDVDAASRPSEYIEGLRHIKGEWASRGETITLEPWQHWTLIIPFGWKHEDTGYRRFRVVYEEVARKNAKTTKAAGLASYALSQDGEPGGEVVTCAVNESQATICFNAARSMEMRTPHTGVSVFKKHLVVTDPDSPAFESTLKPLHSESHSLDGLSISCVINDELHAWPPRYRELYDVIETSTGSRAQPLIWNITTAGTEYEGVCYELRSYLIKILEGIVEDDTFWGCIWTIDKGDEEKAFEDEEVWKKANPNYGVSVYQNDMRRLARQAKEIPSKQSAFLTKRLNVWTNAADAWMNMLKWMAAGKTEMKLEDFKGQEAWLGVDLSSRRDLSSISILFRDTVGGKTHYYSFGRHFLPEDAVSDPINGGHYDGWARAKRLILTPGGSIDVDRIEEETDMLGKLLRVREIAFDPMHNSTQYGVHMENKGFSVVEVRPTVINFSEPTKWLEALVLDGCWHHDNCPVMNWAVSNVVVKPDYKGNVYPRKEAMTRKIDPVVACLMALNRCMANEERVWSGDLKVL